AGDPSARAAQAADGRIGGAGQVLAGGEQVALVVADLDGELFGGGVDEERVGGGEPAAGEGDADGGDVGYPEVPDLGALGGGRGHGEPPVSAQMGARSRMVEGSSRRTPSQ